MLNAWVPRVISIFEDSAGIGGPGSYKAAPLVSNYSTIYHAVTRLRLSNIPERFNFQTINLVPQHNTRCVKLSLDSSLKYNTFKVWYFWKLDKVERQLKSIMKSYKRSYIGYNQRPSFIYKIVITNRHLINSVKCLFCTLIFYSKINCRQKGIQTLQMNIQVCNDL